MYVVHVGLTQGQSVTSNETLPHSLVPGSLIFSPLKRSGIEPGDEAIVAGCEPIIIALVWQALLQQCHPVNEFIATAVPSSKWVQRIDGLNWLLHWLTPACLQYCILCWPSCNYWDALSGVHYFGLKCGTMATPHSIKIAKHNINNFYW